MVIILFIHSISKELWPWRENLDPNQKINLFKYLYLMRFNKCLHAPVENDMQENRLACYLVWRKKKPN